MRMECIEEPFASFSEFYEFLTLVEGDFIPPLFTRINVIDYYNKVKNNAVVIKCYIDDINTGLAIMYANDEVNKRAFITFIATVKEYRGMNVAHTILEKCSQIAKRNGMTLLNIETNNPIARKCYEKAGFVVISHEFNTETLLTRYYMQKKL